MKPTKNMAAALTILLSIGPAGAQTSGSGGASSGTSSGTAGTTSPGGTRGAPAVGSTPTGPVTPNRSNSEVFAPSRLAPRAPGSTQEPSTSTTMPSEQKGAQDPSSLAKERAPSPATGGISGSPKTRKDSSDSVADCQKLWAPETQMSKTDWANTCRRSQDRLDSRGAKQ
jgi:hypothetical protein